MKEYEIKVCASYITDGGSKEWNCFTVYVDAKSASEAKRIAKADLREEGYRNIEMSDVIATN